MMFADPILATYVCVVAGLLGLVTGSFVNCWAWRSLHGESVLRGRSHCTACGHELGVRDLIPVISWLASGRSCRYCGEAVSARYPATELICCAVFVGIAAVYGLSLETIELMLFASCLLFLSLTDIDDYLIPNGCIITAIVVRAVYLAAACAMGTMSIDQVLYYLASGFGIGAALVVVVLVADRAFGRASMGGGDLKLYFVAGLYFGWQQCLLVVILSCLFGIVVAALGSGRAQKRAENEAESATGREDATTVDGGDSPAEAEADAEVETETDAEGDGEESILKRTIPFGPSIAAACVVVMLAGGPIVSWYLSLLS